MNPVPFAITSPYVVGVRFHAAAARPWVALSGKEGDDSMTDPKSTDSRDHDPLLHREMTSLVERLVGRSVEDVLQAADTLHGLAERLGDLGELQRTADATALRRCATSVQALSLQALLTTCQTVAAGERLIVCAQALEKLESP